jgi:predicted nucleotidyltransferase
MSILAGYAKSMDIRARRQAAGMSQAALARAARVPQPNISAYENGRRRPTAEVLERIATALDVPLAVRLDTHRDAIVAAVTEHHAMHPRLFGSIARGDAGVGSDVDLLVDFTDEASLLDEVGLRLALRDLLEVEVDVVGSDSLRGDVRDRILHEAIPL